MVEVNLDEIKAARLEAVGEEVTVVFKGKKFKVPTELSIEAAKSLMRDTVDESVLLWMGEKVGKAFLAQKPSAKDVDALLGEMSKLAGANGAGESQASDDS